MHRGDVSEVVNACDAGREGELIFRFVYEVAKCKKPMRRLWISSMEDDAIRRGFAELRTGSEYDPLYASALCRAKADWLIGINATRLFSVLYNHTLNVGRVQTPTLKMLVDRDAAISTFKKEKYYHVRLSLSGGDAASERLSDRAEADRLKAACEAARAVCTSLVKEKKTAAPPKLFDLTALQREANRLFGYTAKQTLDLAQALYEKRLLTYPRTDSAFLTDDMGDTANSIIALLSGKLPFLAGVSFTPELSKVLNSKKVSDHHAIIPTMEIAKTDLLRCRKPKEISLPLPGRVFAWRPPRRISLKRLRRFLIVQDSSLPQRERPYFLTVGKTLTAATGRPSKESRRTRKPGTRCHSLPRGRPLTIRRRR